MLPRHGAVLLRSLQSKRSVSKPISRIPIFADKIAVCAFMVAQGERVSAMFRKASGEGHPYNDLLKSGSKCEVLHGFRGGLRPLSPCEAFSRATVVVVIVATVGRICGGSSPLRISQLPLRGGTTGSLENPDRTREGYLKAVARSLRSKVLCTC